MKDKELIDSVAKLWVELGGDAKGVGYCWRQLRDRVAELEREDLCYTTME